MAEHTAADQFANSFAGGFDQDPDSKFIGVPKGFKAEGFWITDNTGRRIFITGIPKRFSTTKKQRNRAKKAAQRPLYRVGADITILNKMSQENIAGIQSALWRLGLINKNFQPGIADALTHTAFNKILAGANRASMQWQDYLGDRLALAEETGFDPNELLSGPVRDPLQIQLTSPEDIKAILAGLSSKSIGRKLGPKEEEGFISQVHARETKAQTDAYNLGEESGTVIASPQFTEAVLARDLEAKHPNEFLATQLGEKGQQFYDMLINSGLARQEG